jgi:hypothetical protein
MARGWNAAKTSSYFRTHGSNRLSAEIVHPFLGNAPAALISRHGQPVAFNPAARF